MKKHYSGPKTKFIVIKTAGVMLQGSPDNIYPDGEYPDGEIPVG